MRLIRSIDRVALCILKFVMYITWSLAGLFLLYYAAVWLYVSFVDQTGIGRFLGDASAVNARGDQVMTETERGGVEAFRATTVIKLKQAHSWFATTLLKVESDDYLVGFRWRGDDRLVLTLDFGCNARMTVPVQSLGPIQIVYRFDRTVSLPDHGYSSFPRDAPRKPCE